MTNPLIKLRSARSIIDALGSEEAVADLIAVTPKAVNNWKNWDRFPATTYAVMMYELNNLGYTASPTFWRQVACEYLQIKRVSK